ncbi:hypothetical protein DINM_002446 [Dirofilaria immitis]|nr:hypothetical protein [Dirofilaria immitis]
MDLDWSDIDQIVRFDKLNVCLQNCVFLFPEIFMWFENTTVTLFTCAILGDGLLRSGKNCYGLRPKDNGETSGGSKLEWFPKSNVGGRSISLQGRVARCVRQSNFAFKRKEEEEDNNCLSIPLGPRKLHSFHFEEGEWGRIPSFFHSFHISLMSDSNNIISSANGAITNGQVTNHSLRFESPFWRDIELLPGNIVFHWSTILRNSEISTITTTTITTTTTTEQQQIYNALLSY